jgi:gluconolactonase
MDFSSGFVDCPLVEAGHHPQRLNATDFGFTEGPTNDRHGGIYFCDLKSNNIHRYDIAADGFSIWAKNTQGSNGACFLLDGTLVSCRGHACDLVQWTRDGRVKLVLASKYEDVPFNAPNDLVIARNGWIYFTDPDFNLRGHHPDAVYALSPSGKVRRFEDEIQRPNGILLTPDESTLIINGTRQQDLIAYDVQCDGTLAGRRIYARVREPNRDVYKGYPPENWFGCDGMAIDDDRHLYVTCGAGVEVFNAHCESIGVIVTPEKPCNVCFGGPDRKTLFITAQKSLYSIPVRVPGIIFQQGN